LPVGSAWTAARLVQVRALPLACRDRPAWRARRVRYRCAGGPRGARLGQHRRGPLHGFARATRGNGGHGRGRPGRTRHARRDDWRGTGARAFRPAMIRPNDLGGVPGLGPVEIEPEEPTFHHEWERRAFAIRLATGFLRRWNIDQARAMQEAMSRSEYLAT